MARQRIAVILAAGLGTRMKSSKPKVMHEVLGRPMVHHVVALALDAGCDEVAVVVGYGKEIVERYLRDAFPDAPLSFHVQHEMLGTGDAVRSSRAAWQHGDAQVAILCGDVPNVPAAALEALFEAQRSADRPIAVMSAIAPPNTAYGRMVREDGELRAIVEYKDADQEVRAVREINTGTYVMDAAFLCEEIDQLDTNNAQGEFYLTDLVARAWAHGTPALGIVAEDIREFEGVNNRADLAAANTTARLQRNRALMLQGVTILDPATTWIEHEVEVEPDATIEPYTMLTGRCRVCSGATVLAGTRAHDRMFEAKDAEG